MTLTFTSYDPNQELKAYPAKRALRDPQILGKKAGETVYKRDKDGKVVVTSSLMSPWEEVTKDALTKLHLNLNNPSLEITVIDTTQHNVTTILDWNFADKKASEHWALRHLLARSVSYVQSQTSELTNEAIQELWTSVRKFILAAIMNLKHKKIITDQDIIECEPKKIEQIIMAVQKSKIWMFCIHQLAKELPKVLDHSVEMMIVSMQFAKRYNLPEERSEKLATGALLHDVGELFIEREIANKPVERLTSEERKKKELHTAFGYHVLYEDNEISLMAGFHHEWADGYGMASTQNSLGRADDEKDGKEEVTASTEGIVDEEAEKSRDEEKMKRTLRAKENGSILGMLHRLNFLQKAYPEDPIKAYTLLAQQEQTALTINKSLARAVCNMISTGGYIVRPWMRTELTKDMMQRTGHNKALCAAAIDAIGKQGMMAKLEIEIVAIDKRDPLLINYRIVQNTARSKINPGERVNIARYIDETTLSIRNITHGQPLDQMTFSMDLQKELWVFYPPKSE